ncbi:glycosyltransferase [Heyndrickxia sp. NPDC080065]|uniref:glycosyltransferase n=1 Tax=Heyndrickxia sp. NPDC080065 TaxID=3390568 RepID=UPI003D0190B4
MDIHSIQNRIQILQELMVDLMEQIDEEKSKMDPFIYQTLVSNDAAEPIHHSKYISKIIREENPKARKRYLKYLQKHYDKRYLKKLLPLIEQLPVSNGSRYYEKIRVKIGIIADEFLFNSFKDVGRFVYITKENYEQYADDLDVLLVCTTWKGLNREWKGLGNPNIRKPRQALFEIISFYKSKGIKTVFYSKEDPVNYDIFVDIAKQCEFIFTTALEKVDCYKKDCNNPNVSVLTFGVNPLVHNPIGIRKFPKENEVVFAGSWYNKYPERQADSRMVFDGVVNSNRRLKIIDRNFNLKLEQYFFPKEYVKFISPALDHGDLQKFHKLFNWSMNLNSVKFSSTMFANRVYELQALGNIILSNYNTGINNLFPNVVMVHNTNEMKDILHSFTEKEIYQHQVYGIRKVMSKHTTFQRLHQILEAIGYPANNEERNVAVIVNDMTAEIMDMFNKQTYRYKQLIRSDEFDEQVKNSFDMITFFYEKNEYGEFYLEDMINAFKYTDSDYITKDSFYDGEKLIKGIEHDYVNRIKNKERTVFWSSAFTSEELLSMNGEMSRPNGYSIDPFEFNDQKIGEIVKENNDYKLSVIVPIFNNGDHLLNKCFQSLKRSSLFKEMEIVLVDDGSTDHYTPKIINRLAAQYSNVKAYFFQTGGSGSASRPRNKGFEISTAPFVTYLDPDNEAINDGYYHLYKEIKSKKYDLVVGNMIKVAEDMLHFDYYKTVMAYNHHEVIRGEMDQYLVKTQFKAMSIQALIINRQLIEEHSLQMVEGAIGQDTLFFQELLLHAKRVKAINKDIHIYYGAVSGSVVNSISKKFLEKYFLLEKRRIEVYKQHHIIKDYVEIRFEYYFKNWYLEKLKKIKKEEARDAILILIEIFNLYKDMLQLQDLEMIRFSQLAAQERYDDIWNEIIVKQSSRSLNNTLINY